mmetsp:Transcript_25638/g.47828  ORF Transcript_25638/g.47828 Transcript_25638/m.47828 type:complete len:214 (-) Transcript_25638:232-873(-)
MHSRPTSILRRELVCQVFTELGVSDGAYAPWRGLADATHADVLPVVFPEELDALCDRVIGMVVHVVAEQVNRREEGLEHQRAEKLSNVVATALIPSHLSDLLSCDGRQGEEDTHGQDVSSQPDGVGLHRNRSCCLGAEHFGERLILRNTRSSVNHESRHELRECHVPLPAVADRLTRVRGGVGGAVHQPDPEELRRGEEGHWPGNHRLHRVDE